MIFVNTVIIVVIDALWLSIISKNYKAAIATIQGGSPAFIRPLYAIPVYIALAYLLTFPNTMAQAFLIGLCTYAVYDFTMLTLFRNYPLKLALMDTLWGGILMMSAYWFLKKYPGIQQY
jgi:uncharacterized membrane protein